MYGKSCLFMVLLNCVCQENVGQMIAFFRIAVINKGLTTLGAFASSDTLFKTIAHSMY